MTDFDAIVNDPRLLPFFGWHDDHRDNDQSPAYLPAVQQERAEFLELARVMEECELNGKCLQLGLGHVGGSHLLLQSIFREVWTIEQSADGIAAYKDRIPGAEHFIAGDSHDQAVRAQAEAQGPFDLLFIDAGHLYKDVKADFEDYASMVRPGGIIVLHDALQRGQFGELEVYLFVNELAAQRTVSIIGSEIGTAWTVKE